MANINEETIEEKKLDQVQQILSSGEFFLKYSKKYWNLYEENKGKDQSMLIAIAMQSQMYFRESILNLTTLLSQNRKEANIECLFTNKDRASVLHKKLDLLRKDFKDSRLKDIRNKIIAHKQRSKIGDPLVLYLNRFADTWYVKAEDIYEKVHIYLYENFDAIEGGGMEDIYEESFDYLYKKFQNN